jgi:hypothetical protein
MILLHGISVSQSVSILHLLAMHWQTIFAEEMKNTGHLYYHITWANENIETIKIPMTD